ncbi:MAG: hypothetical protein H6Q90_7037 [Deltaproteobacteria bacterium]|nr:hypothetical protein [Deltaproteobacteria bacterium]
MNAVTTTVIEQERVDSTQPATYFSKPEALMKSLTKWLPYLMLVVGGIAVRADDTGAPPPTVAPAPVSKNMSYADMTSQVSTFEAQLKEELRYLEHLRAQARKEQDIIKLNCVNGRLVELKAQVNLFDTARQQFEGTKDNVEQARTQYDAMTNVMAEAAELRGEANACAGVPDLYKQEAKNDVQHPDFPDDPTVGDPFPEDVEPPIYASPYD